MSDTMTVVEVGGARHVLWYPPHPPHPVDESPESRLDAQAQMAAWKMLSAIRIFYNQLKERPRYEVFASQACGYFSRLRANHGE